ncbi:MAG: hypothetical protein NC131_04475 [Roseburia sp.]|nr:hypothetical protein [Roseburia sp.]
MRKTVKIAAMLAISLTAAFACFAGCRKSVNKSAHVHVYDDVYDGDCNSCGETRIPVKRPEAESGVTPPETITTPTESTVTPSDSETKPSDGVLQSPEHSGEEDDAAADNGFVIGEDTDGLILEGLAASYELSAEIPSFDFTAEELKLYLSSGGERGESVPSENFSVTVSYGGKKLSNLENITAHGLYTVTATLKDYSFKGETVSDAIGMQTTFNVVNPVTAINLSEGKTEQYVSKIDKISAGWAFTATRANGDGFPIPRGEVTLPVLITDVTGTRTAKAEYCGVSADIEYSVLEQPNIIQDIILSYDNKERFVEKGETVTLGKEGLFSLVGHDNGYEVVWKTVFLYNGKESESIELPAKDIPHAFKLKTTVTYTMEGEIQTRIIEKEFFIKVTEIAPEPVNGDLTVGGGEIGALSGNVTEAATLAENGKGSIKVIPSDSVTIAAGACGETEIDGIIFNSALTVAGTEGDFQTCRAVTLTLNEAAQVTAFVSAASFAMINFEDADGNICNPNEYFGGMGNARLTFSLGEGEHTLIILGAVNIYSISATFN